MTASPPRRRGPSRRPMPAARAADRSEGRRRRASRRSRSRSAGAGRRPIRSRRPHTAGRRRRRRALGHRRRATEAVGEEVVAAVERVEHDVLAGGAGLVAGRRHAARVGGHDRRARVGADVLALVDVAGPDRPEAPVGARERIRACHREHAPPARRACRRRERRRSRHPRSRLLAAAHDDPRAPRRAGAAAQHSPSRVLDMEPHEVAPRAHPHVRRPSRRDELTGPDGSGVDPCHHAVAWRAQHDDPRRDHRHPALAHAEAQLRRRVVGDDPPRRHPQLAGDRARRGLRSVGVERGPAGLRTARCLCGRRRRCNQQQREEQNRSGESAQAHTVTVGAWRKLCKRCKASPQCGASARASAP
jgi:hypothetical protein